MKKVIYTGNAPEPLGPYSQGIEANGTLYVSGQIAIDPVSNSLIEGTIEEETHRVIQNIKAILTEASYVFDDVVKCSIFVKRMNDFASINEVYGQYFGESQPARETVEVSCLPKNVNIEISCIAVK
ncbi:RidA family protein [Cyclobacteriaceae bacterium]|nr:RidA family protein [Cyclobacteriaceae bacterium]